MPTSAFAIRLLFWALPGILGTEVYRKLRGGELDTWGLVFEILIFALSSYLLVIVVLNALTLASHHPATGAVGNIPTTAPSSQPVRSQRWSDFGLLEAISDDKSLPAWTAILLGSVSALVLAFVAAFIHNHRVVNRMGQRLGVSRRQADEDIWELFLSSMEGKWILVRDLENKLAYFGVVRMYSDSGRDREILMTSVDVLDSDTAAHQYTTPTLYICRDKDKLIVEVPAASPTDRPTGSRPNGE